MLGRTHPLPPWTYAHVPLGLSFDPMLAEVNHGLPLVETVIVFDPQNVVYEKIVGVVNPTKNGWKSTLVGILRAFWNWS